MTNDERIPKHETRNDTLSGTAASVRSCGLCHSCFVIHASFVVRASFPGWSPLMPLPDVPLRRIDHVRFVVGNARQSAYFYRNAFGLDVVAYAGLETKLRHEAGYVLRQ